MFVFTKKEFADLQKHLVNAQESIEKVMVLFSLFHKNKDKQIQKYIETTLDTQAKSVLHELERLSEYAGHETEEAEKTEAAKGLSSKARKVLKQIESEAQHAYEYEKSHTNSGENYGDAMDIDITNVDGSELAKAIKELIEADVNEELIETYILGNYEMKPGSYHIPDNAVFGLALGEIEVQFPEELISAIDGLDKEELKQIKPSNCYWKPGDHVCYVDGNYDFWWMTVDVDKLKKDMTSAIKNPKGMKNSKRVELENRLHQLKNKIPMGIKSIDDKTDEEIKKIKKMLEI